MKDEWSDRGTRAQPRWMKWGLLACVVLGTGLLMAIVVQRIG